MIECTVCDGSGFIVDTEKRETVACVCRAQRIAERKARRLSTVIPPRYEGVGFERAPIVNMNPHVVGAVRRYVADLDENLAAGRGMWFTGDVGTGKTTLAMLISKSAAERRRTVAIYSVPKLLSQIRRALYADSPEVDLIDALASVDLLHLDDLGAERSTEWVLEQLYAIINARYEDEKAVVVTTNLNREELEEQIGARTVSRLMEMCGDPIPLHGEDCRTVFAT